MMKSTFALLLCVVGTLFVPAAAAPVHAKSPEPIIGSPRDDVLRGTNGPDVIYGRAGRDRIDGLAGTDRIVGGAGADRITCGPGRDAVVGDKLDTIATNCEVVSGVPKPVPRPSPPPPPPATLCLGQPATIVGTESSDLLLGTPGNDIIAGLGGDDVIEGVGGNDLLCGDAGNDRADGGADVDTIESGAGSDTCLNGEAGEYCSSPPIFELVNGASAVDQAQLQEALALTPGIYRSRAGIAIDGITVIAIGEPLGGITAAAGNYRMNVFIGSRGWREATPAMRSKIVAHEYFHLLQDGLSRHRSLQTPSWLLEGSAELMGFFTTEAAGLYDLAAARGALIAEANVSSGPLPTCAAPPDRRHCVYTLGFLAVDNLLRQSGGHPALLNYWKLLGDGLTFEEAFAKAFNRSVAAFYAEFEAYRQTL